MATNKISITNVSAANNTIPSTAIGAMSSRGTNLYAWYNIQYNGVDTYVQEIYNSNTGLHNATAYSTDNGATWTTATNLPATAIWVDNLLYAGGKFVYVAGSSATSSGNTAYSSDGVTWTAGTTITTNYWQSIDYGNGKYMAIAFSTTPNLAYSTNGTSWSTTNLGFSPSYAKIRYGNGVWLVMNSATPLRYWRSTNDGTSWSSALTPPCYASKLYYANGIFIVGDNTSVFVSPDGLSWTNISSQFGLTSGIQDITYYKDTFFLYGFISGNEFLWTSSTGYTWTKYSNTNNILGSNITFAKGDYTNAPFLLMSVINSGATYGQAYKLEPSILGSNGLTYVRVTATSLTGIAQPMTRTLYIKKSQTVSPIYTMQASPGSMQLTSTSDGVVYASAFPSTASLIVYKNGVEQSGWTFSKTDDTGVTSSITGNVVSVSALTTAVDSAFVNVVATKSGEPNVYYKLLVGKNKGGNPSGTAIGSSYSAFSTSQTSVSLKFLTTGYFQVKYGSGSYINAGVWYNPPNAVSPQGGSYWINMNYTSSTSDVLVPTSPSVLNTWQNMNVDREYVLTNAAAGSHIVNLQVGLSTASSGDPSVNGSGTLRLEV